MSVYTDKSTLNHAARLEYASVFEHNGHTVKLVKGEQITHDFGERRATRTNWYRHDNVEVDGVVLDGFIQVRERYYGKQVGRRIESTTCHGGGCVIGSDWQWLAQQNGVDLSLKSREASCPSG